MTLGKRILFHHRHYLPLYALVAIVIAFVTTFPSVAPEGTRGFRDDAAGPFGATPDTSADVGGQPGSPSGTPGAAGGPAGSSGASVVTGSSSRGVRSGAGAFGTTHGGIACRPGVRQIPWSVYAPRCLPEFTGNNGGATYRGVTKDTIRFIVRKLPDDNAIAPLSSQQGLGDPRDWADVRDELTPFFNQMYELYGRKVVIETWTGTGSTFDELKEEGALAACNDAKTIANMQPPVFGVLPYGPAGTSGPFSKCAAEEGLFVPSGPLFFPEASFQKWHPYVWGGVLPAADDIGHDAAEYIGKRLAGRKATWAGDEAFRSRTRTFGMYVPDNDAYAVLGDTIERDGRAKWGFDIASRYDYENDPKTIGTSVINAIAQFKAAKVTTIILASEFVSMKLLTQRAADQNYFPEWFTVGLGWTDYESVARSCNQKAVDGHLFGMSQFGGPKMDDPNGEAHRAWRTAAPGKKAPELMSWVYYLMVDMYNKLQLAGPNLTPAAIAAGSKSYVGGSARAAMGRWSYAQRHSSVSDSREIYWDADAVAFDGKRGAYLETYGGRRFDRGEWTREAPPIYPES